MARQASVALAVLLVGVALVSFSNAEGRLGRSLQQTFQDFQSSSITLNQTRLNMIRGCQWQYYSLAPQTNLPTPLNRVYQIQFTKRFISSGQLNLYYRVGGMPMTMDAPVLTLTSSTSTTQTFTISCTARQWASATTFLAVQYAADNEAQMAHYNVSIQPIAFNSVSLTPGIAATNQSLPMNGMSTMYSFELPSTPWQFFDITFSGITPSQSNPIFPSIANQEFFINNGEIAGSECNYAAGAEVKFSNSTYTQYRFGACLLQGRAGQRQFFYLQRRTGAQPVTNFTVRVDIYPSIRGIQTLTNNVPAQGSNVWSTEFPNWRVAHYEIPNSQNFDYLTVTTSNVVGGIVTTYITQGTLAGPGICPPYYNLNNCTVNEPGASNNNHYPSCTLKLGFPGITSGTRGCSLNSTVGNYFVAVYTDSFFNNQMPVTFDIMFSGGSVTPTAVQNNVPMITSISQNMYQFYEFTVPSTVNNDSVLDFDLYLDKYTGGNELLVYVQMQPPSTSNDDAFVAGPYPCMTNMYNRTVSKWDTFQVPRCALEAGQKWYFTVFGGALLPYSPDYVLDRPNARPENQHYYYSNPVKYTMTVNFHSATVVQSGKPVSNAITYSPDGPFQAFYQFYKLFVPSNMVGQRVDVELVNDNPNTPTLMWFTNFEKLAGDSFGNCCYDYLYAGAERQFQMQKEVYYNLDGNTNTCMFARAGWWYVGVRLNGSSSEPIGYTLTVQLRTQTPQLLTPGVPLENQMVQDNLYREYFFDVGDEADNVEVAGFTLLVNKIHGSSSPDETVTAYIQRDRPATNWCFNEHWSPATFQNSYIWRPTQSFVTQSAWEQLIRATGGGYNQDTSNWAPNDPRWMHDDMPAWNWNWQTGENNWNWMWNTWITQFNTHNVTGCLNPGRYYVGITGVAEDYYVPIDYYIRLELMQPTIIPLTNGVTYYETSANQTSHYKITVTNADVVAGSALQVKLTNIKYGTAAMWVTVGGLAGPDFNECRPTRAFCTNWLPPAASTSSNNWSDTCVAVVDTCLFTSGTWYIFVDKTKESSSLSDQMVNYDITATVTTPAVTALTVDGVSTMTQSLQSKVNVNAYQHFTVTIPSSFSSNVDKWMRVQVYMDTQSRLEQMGLRVHINNGFGAGQVSDDGECRTGFLADTAMGEHSVDYVVPYCQLRPGTWFISVFGIQNAADNINAYPFGNTTSFYSYNVPARFTLRVTIEQPTATFPGANLNSATGAPLWKTFTNTSRPNSFDHYKLDTTGLAEGRYVTLRLRNVQNTYAKLFVYPNRLAGTCSRCPYFRQYETAVTGDGNEGIIVLPPCMNNANTWYYSVHALPTDTVTNTPTGYSVTVEVNGLLQSLTANTATALQRVNSTGMNTYKLSTASIADGSYISVNVYNVSMGNVTMYANLGSVAGPSCGVMSCQAGLTERREFDTTSNFYSYCRLVIGNCMLRPRGSSGVVGDLYVTVVGQTQSDRATPIMYQVRADVVSPVAFTSTQLVNGATLPATVTSVARFNSDVYTLNFGTLNAGSFFKLTVNAFPNSTSDSVTAYLRPVTVDSACSGSSLVATTCTTAGQTGNKCDLEISPCGSTGNNGIYRLFVEGVSSVTNMNTNRVVPYNFTLSKFDAQPLSNNSASVVTIPGRGFAIFSFTVNDSPAGAQFRYAVKSNISSVSVFANYGPASSACSSTALNCNNPQSGCTVQLSPCATQAGTYFIVVQNTNTAATTMASVNVTAWEIPVISLTSLSASNSLVRVDSAIANSPTNNYNEYSMNLNNLRSGAVPATVSVSLNSTGNAAQLFYTLDLPSNDNPAGSGCCNSQQSNSFTIDTCSINSDTLQLNMGVTTSSTNNVPYTLSVRYLSSANPLTASISTGSPSFSTVGSTAPTVAANGFAFVRLSVGSGLPAGSAYYWRVFGDIQSNQGSFSVFYTMSSFLDGRCGTGRVQVTPNSNGWVFIYKNYQNGVCDNGAGEGDIFVTIQSNSNAAANYQFEARLVTPIPMSVNTGALVASRTNQNLTLQGFPLVYALSTSSSFSQGATLNLALANLNSNSVNINVLNSSLCTNLVCRVGSSSVDQVCNNAVSGSTTQNFAVKECQFPFNNNVLIEVQRSATASQQLTPIASLFNLTATISQPSLVTLNAGLANQQNRTIAAGTRTFFSFTPPSLGLSDSLMLVVNVTNGTGTVTTRVSFGSVSVSDCAVGNISTTCTMSNGVASRGVCRPMLPPCARNTPFFVTVERASNDGGTVNLPYTINVQVIPGVALSPNTTSFGWVYPNTYQVYSFNWQSNPANVQRTLSVTVNTTCAAGSLSVMSYAPAGGSNGACGGPFTCTSNTAGMWTCTSDICVVNDGTFYISVMGVDGSNVVTYDPYTFQVLFVETATVVNVRPVYDSETVIFDHRYDQFTQYRFHQDAKQFGGSFFLIDPESQYDSCLPHMTLYKDYISQCSATQATTHCFGDDDDDVLCIVPCADDQPLYYGEVDWASVPGKCAFVAAWKPNYINQINVNDSHIVYQRRVARSYSDYWSFNFTVPVNPNQRMMIWLDVLSGDAVLNVERTFQFCDVSTSGNMVTLSNCALGSYPFYVSVYGNDFSTYELHVDTTVDFVVPALTNHQPLCSNATQNMTQYYQFTIDQSWQPGSWLFVGIKSEGPASTVNAYLKVNNLPASDCNIIQCSTNSMGFCNMMTTCQLSQGARVLVAVSYTGGVLYDDSTMRSFFTIRADWQTNQVTAISDGGSLYQNYQVGTYVDPMYMPRPRFYSFSSTNGVSSLFSADSVTGGSVTQIRSISMPALTVDSSSMTGCFDSAVAGSLFCGTGSNALQYLTVVPDTFSTVNINYVVSAQSLAEQPTIQALSINSTSSPITFNGNETKYFSVPYTTPLALNALFVTVTPQTLLTGSSTYTISYAEVNPSTDRLCSVTFNTLPSGGFFPTACIQNGQIWLRITQSSTCQETVTVTPTWIPTGTPQRLTLSNAGVVQMVTTTAAETRTFEVDMPSGSDFLYVVLDGNTVPLASGVTVQSVLRRGLKCATPNMTPIMREVQYNSAGTLVGNVYYYPFRCTSDKVVTTYYINVQTTSATTYRIKVGFGVDGGNSGSLGGAGFTDGNTFNLNRFTLSPSSRLSIQTSVANLNYPATESATWRFVNMEIVKNPMDGCDSDGYGLILDRMMTCSVQTSQEGLCTLYLPTISDALYNYSSGAVNTFPTHVGGYGMFQGQFQSTTGTGNCESASSLSFGTNHICSGIFPSGYQTWTPFNFTASAAAATSVYNFYRSYFLDCPDPNCDMALRRYVCMDTFRRCDSQGMLHGLCPNMCSDVVKFCRKTWWEGRLSDFNIFRNFIPDHNCLSNMYDWDFPGQCSGNTFNPPIAAECPDNCSGVGQCAVGYCVCDNGLLSRNCAP